MTTTSKTLFDEWKDLLTRSNVAFEQRADGSIEIMANEDDNRVTEKWSDDQVNEGYFEFYVKMRFDESGKVTKFGIWE